MFGFMLLKDKKIFCRIYSWWLALIVMLGVLTEISWMLW